MIQNKQNSIKALYRLFHNFCTHSLRYNFLGAPSDNSFENFTLNTWNHSYYNYKTQSTAISIIWPAVAMLQPCAATIICFNQKLHYNVLQCAQQWPYNNVHIVLIDQMAETINVDLFYIGLDCFIFYFQRNCQWGLHGNCNFLLLCNNCETPGTYVYHDAV